MEKDQFLMQPDPLHYFHYTKQLLLSTDHFFIFRLSYITRVSAFVDGFLPEMRPDTLKLNLGFILNFIYLKGKKITKSS